MKIMLKGVRGSIPTTGADTAYYGGNTSCVVVEERGWMLVLDGGSGMQKVTLPDNGLNRIDILLTHLHFDHIQGLGFFAPLFNPAMEVHIWGPASATQTLHARLSRYLSPPLFPVLIRDLPCQLSLHDVVNSEFEIGPFTITSRFVIHPGPTVGYRISNKDAVFTYLPDHEPALGLTGLLHDTKWISGYDLAIDTDLLCHDAQYTAEEYAGKKGWGHSAMEDTIEFASICGVKKLLLSHHDPFHTDTMLNGIYADLLQKPERPFSFDLAKEGMEINL